MKEIEVNKVIAEAMGLNWHNFEISEGYPICAPSYTSNWSDYGQALEWAMGKGWWLDFIDSIAVCWMPTKDSVADCTWDLRSILNPLRGSTALAEFIQSHPEHFKEAKLT